MLNIIYLLDIIKEGVILRQDQTDLLMISWASLMMKAKMEVGSSNYLGDTPPIKKDCSKKLETKINDDYYSHLFCL